LAEILRGAVVGGSTLVAPAPVWDAVTASAITAEREAAKREGYARGVADGRAEVAAELARVGGALTAALDHLHAELAAQRDAATAVDLELVLGVVEAVLGVAPPAAATTVLDRVREAAAMLDDPSLEVRINPGDLAVIAGAALDPRLELVGDDTVAPGEAEVNGTWGRADLRRAALRDAALAQLAGPEAPVDSSDAEVSG
jgi:flagellar assembly protein FliH